MDAPLSFVFLKDTLSRAAAHFFSDFHFTFNFKPKIPLEKKITRELLAYYLHYFCKCFSDNLASRLTKYDSIVSNLDSLLALTKEYSWTTTFFDPDLAKYISEVLEHQEKKSTFSNQKDSMLYVLSLFGFKNRFKLHTSRNNPEIYHYTSLSALEKMTQIGAKFRLSNTAYLNDPQEGLLGLDIIKSFESSYPKLKKWDFWHQPQHQIQTHPSFIASFMSEKDLLPMWGQYGDNGAGCCLGFDTSDIHDDLYAITYSKNEFERFIESIFDILDEYHSKNPKISINDDPLFSYAEAFLLQSRYLFKDPAYQHEKEIRIIKFAPFTRAKAEPAPRPGEIFPRIFLETEIEGTTPSPGLPFSSIVLGPKVSNAEQIAVALSQRGYNSSIISKSTISFR